MDKYVITLTGQGDTDVVFVDEDVWEWIHDRSLPMPQSVREGLLREARAPDAVFKDQYAKMTDADIIAESADQEGELSWGNDRALCTVATAGSASFDNIGAAMNWASENNVKVKKSYEGFIY